MGLAYRMLGSLAKAEDTAQDAHLHGYADDLTGFCVHRREEPALPKSAGRGNLTLDKAVIRWTSSGRSGGASRQPCTSPSRVAGREKVFA